MKKIIVLFFIILGSSIIKAQILAPVKWSYGTRKINSSEILVFIKATIDNGWHIYSLNQQDGGPLKTSIAIDKSSDYNPIGHPKEPLPFIHYEKSFSMNVQYFENSVVFQQKIKVNKPVSDIKGKITFMVCNDHQCLPPDSVNFTIPIK